MAVRQLQIHHFRCIAQAAIEPAPGLNLLVGANGSGKTSVLEALYVLGRGRSFRAPRLGAVVQAGQVSGTVFGRFGRDATLARVGIEFGAQPTQIRLNGESGGSVADLVRALPVQLIDPEIHELIQGGPGQRRRFMDWGVFHVKHEFLSGWRRFRRALQQRNAALRQAASESAIGAWDSDLIRGATEVDRCRREYLQLFSPIVEKLAVKMLNLRVTIDYRAGWPVDREYPDVLQAAMGRDRALGTTQFGPHRAELVIGVDDEAARHRLSRGQQKMLAACLVLAQNALVGSVLDTTMTLLVDEPAAELDRVHLESLLGAVEDCDAQVFITALSEQALPLKAPAARFHVERGRIASLL